MPFLAAKGKPMSTVIEKFDQAKKESAAVGLKLQQWCLALIAIRIREVERRLMDSDMPIEDEPAAVSWWSQHAG